MRVTCPAHWQAIVRHSCHMPCPLAGDRQPCVSRVLPIGWRSSGMRVSCPAHRQAIVKHARHMFCPLAGDRQACVSRALLI